MKFKINFTHLNGDDDFLIIEADTLEEIREIAEKEVSIRNGQNPWSEKLS